MTSGNDLEKNFETAKNMIERAGEKKCEVLYSLKFIAVINHIWFQMVFFPECFDFIGINKTEQVDLAMTANCEYIQRYRDLAKQNKVWLSLGGLHHKVCIFLNHII